MKSSRTALTIAAFLSAVAAQPTFAQGLSEYGGLMAMPRGVPTGAAGALTNTYNSIKIPTGSSSTGSSPQAVSPGLAAYQIMGPDGNPQVDPKKIKEMTERAAKAYEAGKAGATAANPTAAKLKEAEAKLREAITLRNSIWGYQDPHMPAMLNLLGSVYEKQKNPTHAEACYKQALVYLNRGNKAGSYDKVNTLVNLARLTEGSGNKKDAYNYYNQIAAIRERQSGAGSLVTTGAQIDLARAAAALQKDDAEDLYEKALASLEKSDRKEKKLYGELVQRLSNDYPQYLSHHHTSKNIARINDRLIALEREPAATAAKK